MKKLLLFFTVVLSVLLLPSQAYAWSLDGSDPSYFTIVGYGFANPDNNWPTSTDDNANWKVSNDCPKATWVSSQNKYIGKIKATAGTIYLKIAFDDGNGTHKGTYGYDNASISLNNWSAAFDSQTDGQNNYRNIEVTGLTHNSLYNVEIQKYDGKPQLRVVPYVSSDFTLNGTAPKIVGWNLGFNDDSHWTEPRVFTRVGTSTNPYTYQYSFEAQGTTVYLSLMDSNGSYFKPTELSLTGTNSTTSFTGVSGNMETESNHSSISDLTDGGQYVLKLTESEGKVMFSIEQSKPNAPEVTVDATNYLVITHSNSGDCTVTYQLSYNDGDTWGTEQTYNDSDRPLMDESCFIRAYVTKDISGVNKKSDASAVYNYTFRLPAPVVTVTTASDQQSGTFTVDPCPHGTKYTREYRKKGETSWTTYTTPITVTETCTYEFRYVDSNSEVPATVTTQVWKNPADLPDLYWTNASEGWNYRSPKKFQYDPATQTYTATIPVTTANSTDAGFRISTGKAESKDDSSNWFNNALVASAALSNEQQRDLTSSSSNTAAITTDARGSWTITVTLPDDDNSGTITGVKADLFPAIQYSDWTLSSDKIMARNSTKYFYMSALQNDSRLSPEWELLPKGDGEYALEQFMVIPAGDFIIRQVTKDGSGNLSYKDLGTGNSPTDITRSSFTLGTSPTAGTYTADLGTPGSATPYGYLWNVGYTMANVRVKENNDGGMKPVATSSQYVVYSGTYRGKAPYIHIWDQDDNNKTMLQPMKPLGDGTYYYVLEATWTPAHFLMDTDGSWGGDESGHLQWDSSSKQMQVTYSGETSSETPSASAYTGSIKEVYVAPTVNLTAEIDLTKPSTLTGAPVKGMPWVGLMGSRMMIPDGDSQSINTTDADKCGDLSNTLQNTAANGATDAADQLKTGYTMAYMQYTEDGKLLRYGNLGSDDLLYYRDNVANLSTSPKNLNKNNGFDFDGTIRVPKKNQLMNSTIQPPRNLIQFRVEKGTSAISLGSGKTTFNYVGVEDHNFQNENGTQHKYAVYEIKGVNMLGKYKIISGFGGQVYGRTPHGLSPYNNWGVKDAESAPYSSEVITESKSYMALTGAGPRIGNDDKAWREYNLNTKGDGITDDKEDNTAGKYFELSDKSYVSSLKFYFALEPDDDTSAHYPVDDKAGQDVSNTSYKGRNFSWLFCDKSGSEGMISLDKVGLQNGVIEYAINSGEEGDDLIDSYTVKLFKVENPNSVQYEGEKIKNGTEINGTEIIWELPWTAEDVESLGDSKGEVLYTHSHTEAGLENGWYVAQLYVKFKEDPESQAVTEKVYTTDFIRIFGVSGKPELVAKQVINTNESAKTKEYTFNVTLDSNLRKFAEENAADDASKTPDKFGVRVIIPCTKNVQTVTVDASDENVEKQYDDDNNTYRVTFKAGYFASAATDASRYQLPTITVSNYIPGEKVKFQIDAAYYIGDDLSKPASNYATVTIAAPAPAMKEMSAAAYEYKKGAYNAVKVASDLILADEGVYHTSLSAKTIEAFAPTYSLTYYDAKEGAEPLTLDNVASVTDGTNTSPAKVEVTGLPYYGKQNGYGTVAAPQNYMFSPSIIYTRKDDEVASAAVKGAIETVPYDAKDLWSPRGKRYDNTEESSENAIEDLKQGDDPLGESGDADKDWRVVDHRWFEKYGGVCTNVDDAYIAAKINPANGELAYKFDIDHQYIFQGGMFAKQKHLTGSADEGVNEKAPSKYFDQLHPLNGKALDPFKTDTHDGQNLVWWNQRQNGSCPPNYIATVTKVAQPANPSENTTIQSRLTDFGSEDYKIWAGCPEEVQTPYKAGEKHLWTDGKGGQYDLFDPNNAYHGMLDHHKMRGWNGGELPNGNAIDRLFGLTKSGDSYKSSGLGSYVLSESQAIALRNDIEEILVRDTETLDVKLKDGKTKEQLAELWSGAGRIVLRVPHVNHETWWEPTPWDIFRAWKEYGTDTEKKEKYSRMTDEELFKEVIYLPGAKYNPAEYRFTYDYPFLAETSLIAVNNAAEKKTKAQARSAESPVVNDIASISTGRIPFDGVEKIKTGTPTSIDDLGAEPDPSAVSIRYLGGLQQVVVSSAAELPAVQVVSVSGAVVKSVPAVQGRTEIVIPVDGLSSGAYIVSVGALKSSKFMK